MMAPSAPKPRGFFFWCTMQQTDMFDSTKVAKQVLEHKLDAGLRRISQLEAHLESRTIKDFIVEPRELDFEPNKEGDLDVAIIYDMPQRAWFKINRHALGQVCSKLRIPLSYVDHLNNMGDDGQHLAAYNLKELINITPFKNKPLFLVRTVGTEIRGFLSNRYALHLSTDPLFGRFVDYCKEQGAKPFAADWSPLRLQAHCVLPYVYSPFDRLNIVVGMAFFNSDFGAGSFSVYPSVFDIDRGFSLVLSSLDMGSTMNKDLFNKIHLGPALHKEDINKISTDRARRVDEVSKEMRENIAKRLSKEFCNTVCKVIAEARDTETTWVSIKRQLAGQLLKEELQELEKMLKERDAKLPSLQLDPDGLPIPTNWWASQAVAYLASTTTDPDRKIDLEKEAGTFLT